MRHRIWIIILVAGGLLSVNSSASQADEQAAQKADASGGQTAKVEVANVYRAGEMLGLEVRNRDHKRLGKMNDLVTNVNNGEIRYVVLSHGGVAGIGSKLFVIPWPQLTFVVSDKDRYFVYDTTPEQLQKAPGFDSAHWPDIADPEWAAKIDEYFRGDQPVNTERQPTALEEKTTFVRASKVRGMKVRNEQDQNLGSVDEIVLDLKVGRIKYLALSYGSTVGLGGKLFAIPLNAFTLKHAPKDEYFILKVSPEELKRAPGFDKNHWPDMADPKWSSEIDEFYEGQAAATPRDVKK